MKKKKKASYSLYRSIHLCVRNKNQNKQTERMKKSNFVCPACIYIEKFVLTQPVLLCFNIIWIRNKIKYTR